MPNDAPKTPPSQPSVAGTGIVPDESPASAVEEPSANGVVESLTEVALELFAVLPPLL